MGYNTTINIINDQFDQLERDPAGFVQGIRDLMLRGGLWSGAAQIAPTDHADNSKLYAVNGNLLLELSPYSQDTTDLARRRPDLVRSAVESARWQLDSLERWMNDARGR